MANGTDTQSCAMTSMIVAAIAGVVIAALLMVLGDWRFIQAVFAGLIAAIIIGFILVRFLCSESTAKEDLENVRSGNAGAAAASASATAAVAATSATATAADAAPQAETAAEDGAASRAQAATAEASATTSGGVEIKPSKPLAGQAELAARKGTWKYEAPEAEKKAPAKKPAAKKAPAKKATAPAADKPAKAKRAPVAADGKPETLAAARAGGADDLKLISGVGPKLEGMLNKLGFWHFDQVASWRKKEVQWVNDNLEGFKGRVERDDWVSQAKILAKGGETEFSKRKKK